MEFISANMSSELLNHRSSSEVSDFKVIFGMYYSFSIQWTCKKTGRSYYSSDFPRNWTFGYLVKFYMIAELIISNEYFDNKEHITKYTRHSYRLVPVEFKPESEPVVMNIL